MKNNPSSNCNKKFELKITPVTIVTQGSNKNCNIMS